MRSLFLALIAIALVSSNADEQFARHRLGNDAIQKKNTVRGLNAKYVGLAAEVDMKVQNRVQRRHLKGDMDNGGKDTDQDTGDDLEEQSGGDMSMSL